MFVSPLIRQRASRASCALAAAAVGLFSTAAAAAESPWAAAELAPGTVVEARLIAATNAVGALDAVPAGLHVALPDGWKTYWRSPGDAGLPPRLDWAGSANLADARIDWPAPHRFTLFGLETFGYADEVVFPLTLTPETPGRAMALDARVDLLVCRELCVPATMALALDLPAGPATPDGDAANLIERFAARVPGDGGAVGLAIDGVTAPDPEILRVAATAREPFEAPDLFVEAPPGWAFGKPSVDLGDGGRRLVADVPVTQAPDGAGGLDGQPVTLTLVDGARAMERTATAGTLAPPPIDAASGALLGMLGAALLGGLILNLMPCVLPVLSLKLLSVVQQGGRAPGRIRLGFLAAAAGILASFLALAAAAIAVKAAGGAVGWGIQFQQPLFVIAMVVVLTLFACNLLGLFEIALPAGIAGRAARFGGDDGLGGHFATGAFAALLATPCSAPFLGTAVGFALARGPVEILAIFAALGLGLALPWLLVAAVPRLAARLPKPGPWMAKLKTALSFALAAAAVWLLSVLAAQEGPAVAYAVAGLMAGVALALWSRRRLHGGVRLASSAAAGVLALAAFAAPLSADRPDAAATAPAAADWTAFDRARIDALVADGRTVFVDVTADWCITCQANKALVLDRGAVAERLGDGSVVPMRADWTRPDDRIAAFLADHGRYGVPFNAVFGPAAPDGVVLPELLTADAVLGALARAGGRRPGSAP